MQIFKRDNKYLSTSTWLVYETSSTSFHDQSCHPSVLLLSFLCQFFNFLPLLFLFVLFFFFFFFFRFFLRSPSSFVVWILILPLERSIVQTSPSSCNFFFFFFLPRRCFPAGIPLFYQSGSYSTNFKAPFPNFRLPVTSFFSSSSFFSLNRCYYELTALSSVSLLNPLAKQFIKETAYIS